VLNEEKNISGVDEKGKKLSVRAKIFMKYKSTTESSESDDGGDREMGTGE